MVPQVSVSFPPVANISFIGRVDETAETCNRPNELRSSTNLSDEFLHGQHLHQRTQASFPGNVGPLIQYLEKFFIEDVFERRIKIENALKEVMEPMKTILSLVEQQEPRFKNFSHYFMPETMEKCFEDRYRQHQNPLERNFSHGNIGPHNFVAKGVKVLSSTEFEILVYLSHSGTFTMNEFIDPTGHSADRFAFQSVQPVPCYSTTYQQRLLGIPGTAVLKLSDGRKRSMSLWVELITASGFLSARKMRSKFRQLVIQALESLPVNERKLVRLENEETKEEKSSDVEEKKVLLVFMGIYKVTLTLAFRCENAWPRSIPLNNFNFQWQMDIKSHGFDLISKKLSDSCEIIKTFGSTSCHMFIRNFIESSSVSNEDDIWQISFDRIQSLLINQDVFPGRRKCLELLETLIEKHCQHIDGKPVETSLLENLLLHESEKHPQVEEWQGDHLGERLVAILVQLLACLRSRSCRSYFIRGVDILRSKSPQCLDLASIEVWKLLRRFLFMASNRP